MRCRFKTRRLAHFRTLTEISTHREPPAVLSLSIRWVALQCAECDHRRGKVNPVCFTCFPFSNFLIKTYHASLEGLWGKLLDSPVI